MQPEGPITGGCQCGKVRYEINGEIVRQYVCHCTLCQQQSASAFGISLIVPQETFSLTAGELKMYETVADSGRTKYCAFCADCGTRLYNQSSEFRSVKAGTLDDTSWIKPDAHIWTRSKQAWVTLPDDVPCFETDPA